MVRSPSTFHSVVALGVGSRYSRKSMSDGWPRRRSHWCAGGCRDPRRGCPRCRRRWSPTTFESSGSSAISRVPSKVLRPPRTLETAMCRTAKPSGCGPGRAVGPRRRILRYRRRSCWSPLPCSHVCLRSLRSPRRIQLREPLKLLAHSTIYRIICSRNYLLLLLYTDGMGTNAGH